MKGFIGELGRLHGKIFEWKIMAAFLRAGKRLLRVFGDFDGCFMVVGKRMELRKSYFFEIEFERIFYLSALSEEIKLIEKRNFIGIFGERI